MTTKANLLKMIRQFCSECMGGPQACANVWPIENPGMVDDCTASECIWYKYRFAKDPKPNPKRVEKGRKLAAQMQSGLEKNA